MISVLIRRDHQGLVYGFRCSGHAGYREKGYDIVCAAVSTLVFTSALALERLLKLPLKVNQDDTSGIMDCGWENIPAGSKCQETDLVIKVMLLGLNEIQQQYPEFVKIDEVEV